MARKNKIPLKRKEEFIKMCRDTRGFKTPIANHFNCCLNTVNRRLKEWPEAQEAFDDAYYELGDDAEMKLAKKVEEGNLTAIIFLLKTKYKHRGYSERSEITGAEGNPLEIKGEGLAGILAAGEALMKENAE